MAAKFKNIVRKLSSEGANDPEALAAWIGRDKYGKSIFQSMAARGKKKKGSRRK